jgi:hypothetical protein
MKFNNFNLEDKIAIAKQLRDYTNDEMKKDFLKLKSVSKINLRGLMGNKIVDNFTFYERLEVRGLKGINYYDFLSNIHEYQKRNYYKTLEEYNKKTRNIPEKRLNYKYAQLYFSLNVAIFKPIIAKYIYSLYKPKSILDFCMGWGGRMVGACSLDIPNYIGIDLNKDLEKPISDMVNFISPYTQTKTKLFFEDALTVDYSTLFYDFVLTSPPYYNIEIYKYNKKLKKEEWDNNFYIPIITKTFKYLQPNGVYCLNIPVEVYEIAKKILGEANKQIEMQKSPRTQTIKTEYIYIWYKNPISDLPSENHLKNNN